MSKAPSETLLLVDWMIGLLVGQAPPPDADEDRAHQEEQQGGSQAHGHDGQHQQGEGVSRGGPDPHRHTPETQGPSQ